jgi:hypothetical protein
MAKQLLLTVFGAIVAGFSVALGCAITLAVVDIYLAGHGRATLGRPWIDGALVHMSRADLILCFVSIGSALIAGWAIWRSSGRRT